MKISLLRILNSFFDFLINPLITLSMAVPVATWWTNFFTKDQEKALIAVVFFFLCLLAFTYENGYKKYYRAGWKVYFYILHILPLSLALLGFFYGIFRM